MTVYVCVCASMSDNTAVCEFAASGNSSVKCLAYSAVNSSVYVVLNNSRMVVCNAEVTLSRSPVRTECHGNGRPIHCIAVRTLDSGFVHCLLLRQVFAARYLCIAPCVMLKQQNWFLTVLARRSCFVSFLSFEQTDLWLWFLHVYGPWP